MTHDRFPMFDTPNEAGGPAVANGYPAYLLGSRSTAPPSSADGDVAVRDGSPQKAQSRTGAASPTANSRPANAPRFLPRGPLP